jgi:hypothetical protein
MKQDYTPGEECQCSAYNESECGCGADWTPREVYELREQRDRLAEERDLWKAEAERWREQAGENFQVTAWKQLIEQERNRMRGL